MSAGIAWKWRRLKTMSAAEVLWRLRQAATARLERLGIGLASTVPATGSAGPAWVSDLPLQFNVTRYVDAAERILAGEWDMFALRRCQLGFPPRWNRDPKTRVEAPLGFGKEIDYRDERIVGDIKYLWELNRHLELVTLAQAWHLTREPRFAEGARVLLSSWLEQCPYPNGVNWTNSLELGVRLVNWACAWHLLGGETSPLFIEKDGHAFRQRWLEAIYRHCHFVAGYGSRYSSANNHLLGESLGLFIASVTWPLWPESGRWRERAKRELEAEAIKQNATDGTNREQAFWYHHEVADTLLLCLLFGRSNGIEFSDGFRARLESMIDFIAAVMDAGGHVPMVGDADDAVMVRFSREPEFCPYRSLLATGSVLFRRGDFKPRARAFDDKSRWLLGDDAAREFDAVPQATGVPVRRAFSEGGYYILGTDFGTSREISLIADAGPLGYLSIAAHGHADALAFTLSVGGREVLIDPGTYAYHSQTRWRGYFRGTAAHNTLRVDGQDQSVSGGNFMWLAHARAQCEKFDTGAERDVFEGKHDGYLRLSDPVHHRRRIEFSKPDARIIVRDTLECRGGHAVEMHWHLAEDCAPSVSGQAVNVACGEITLRVDCPPELGAPQVVLGQEDPPLGWVSRRYDEKTPSPVIVCAGRVNGSISLVTVFTIVDAGIRDRRD